MTAGGSARSAHLRRRTSRLAVGPRRPGPGRPVRMHAVRTAVGVGCLLAAMLGGMYASFSLAALLWFAPLGAALVICALIALPTRRHRIAAAWLAPFAFGWIGALIVLASTCGLIGLSLLRRLARASAPYLAAIRDEERNNIGTNLR